ncbi:MAG: TatD family hydrolase [Oscillospiraceae bacterium]|nr:TatD family hydrolase [Oscillospiraceae bacterium]
MLFDTHAHINDKRFNTDREQVISSAKDCGVAYMLNVSYDERSVSQSISLAGKYPFIYAAIGIHPHYVKNHNESVLVKMEQEYLENNKIVAVGEIGLDFYRDLSPRELQKEWFVKQIHLAKKLKAPIIVHNRESNDASVEIIKAENAGEYGGIIHSFSGDKAMLNAVLDAGMHISFSGPVTYKSAADIREIIKIAPIDRILIETDCPYLTPEPYRGRRNEPAYVRFVAEEIARIKKMDFEEVAEITTQNAFDVLKL